MLIPQTDQTFRKGAHNQLDFGKNSTFKFILDDIYLQGPFFVLMYPQPEILTVILWIVSPQNLYVETLTHNISECDYLKIGPLKR